jgi:hypothetical protein
LETTGNATWLSNISVGAGNLDLETIIKQKYIAGFNTPQPFVDFRRTGYPALANSANATGNIPRRYPYAQNELDYNKDNVPQVTMQTNVWWDN